MKELRITNCEKQIAKIEYYCGLTHIDDRGQEYCLKDTNGNYLDERGDIIDIDNIEWFSGETVKQAIDYWKQQLNILLNK